MRGQKEVAEVVTKLDAKYSSRSIRVVYCGDVYYPPGEHAPINDTAELLYLGGDKCWVRNVLIVTAVSDPVRKPGEKRDPNAKSANNEISGDACQSTPEIGKVVTDFKINAAVDEIHRLLTPGPAAAR